MRRVNPTGIEPVILQLFLDPKRSVALTASVQDAEMYFAENRLALTVAKNVIQTMKHFFFETLNINLYDLRKGQSVFAQEIVATGHANLKSLTRFAVIAHEAVGTAKRIRRDIQPERILAVTQRQIEGQHIAFRVLTENSEAVWFRFKSTYNSCRTDAVFQLLRIKANVCPYIPDTIPFMYCVE